MIQHYDGFRVGEEIDLELERSLQLAGRDWIGLDRALTGFERRLLGSLGSDPTWFADYREFLRWELALALDRALDRAVEQEEYERAAAIQRFVAGLRGDTVLH